MAIRMAFDAGQYLEDHADQPARILVVDADPALRRTLVDYVDNHSMRAVPASRRQEVVHLLSVREPSLVILDRQLEEGNGLGLLREIRSLSDVPVIITGHQDDEIDRVIGLELGADDYVVKPFSLRELVARIRAVLRRQKIGRRTSRRGCYQFGGWQLDKHIQRLTNPDGAAVALTKGEYALLIVFLDAPQRPLTREHLLQATGAHEDVFDRSIDVHVLRLRRKLEAGLNAPRIIQTERGVGYVFALPVETF